MQKSKWIVAGIFIAIIAVAAARRIGSGPSGPLATSSPASMPQTATAPSTQPASQAGQVHGMALQLHSGYGDLPYRQYVQEIAASGSNSVCFVIHGLQENASSTSIFIDRRKTPSDQELLDLLAMAHKLGLKTMIMPVVLLENPRSGEWRGKIDPSDWAAWWEDYTNFVLHYARLAAEGKADLYLIGSELISTETQEDRWREVITQVRATYSGPLSYSSNWDHYMVVKWWDALDYIGMTTYYDLTGGQDATLDRMGNSWQKIRKDILAWHEQNWPNKKIIFTEVGWPNQVTCAQYPWNYYASPDKPDPTTQANCFQSFFDTWVREPAVAGFIVWEWRSLPTQAIDSTDTSYTPCGKPAMDVIRRYYQGSGTAVLADSPTTAPAQMPACKG